ncbi:MAG TPA: F0F1 ATP synthase subunit B [Sphingomicrobium sp.]|nr:F0F1 ATP synthase subunit B [Sphingomicrobium sp.]
MLETLVLTLAAEAAAAGEHGAEHAEPTALWLDPTGWVALAMVAVILLMVRKKVPAAIGKALDKKIALIRDQLEEAKSLRQEAEALKAEYQAKAAAADGEAKAIIERAEAESKAIVKKARADAEALVERRGKMAEAKIAAEERAAIDEIRASAASIATAAAAKLIADRNDAANDKALVDQAIAQVAK